LYDSRSRHVVGRNLSTVYGSLNTALHRQLFQHCADFIPLHPNPLPLNKIHTGAVGVGWGRPVLMVRALLPQKTRGELFKGDVMMGSWPQDILVRRLSGGGRSLLFAGMALVTLLAASLCGCGDGGGGGGSDGGSGSGSTGNSAFTTGEVSGPTASAPEPASFALFLCGAGAAASLRYLRKRSAGRGSSRHSMPD